MSRPRAHAKSYISLAPQPSARRAELVQPRYDSLLRACWAAAAQYFEEFLAVATPSTEQQLIDSLNDDVDEGLALAAAADVFEDELVEGLFLRLKGFLSASIQCTLSRSEGATAVLSSCIGAAPLDCV